MKSFLSHSALRLTCNHAGYAPLWTEQVDDAWREQKLKHTWPVLEGDDERWAVRAAIDAVVADAYGLDRAQYEHVLSTFSHRSYPKAPELCLTVFEELKAIGLEAFAKKHDPYWDIPLNESLPKPVIDLAVPGEAKPSETNLGPLFSWNETATGRKASSKVSATATGAARVAGDGNFETIVRILEEQSIITSRDAQDATGLDAVGVRPHLKRLVDEGIAVIEGQLRGTRYRRTPNA
jgi:hypothetical protein